MLRFAATSGGSVHADKPLKILQVIGAIGDAYGGPSKVALEMCRHLGRRGHGVTLVTTNANLGRHLDVPLGQPVRREGFDTWYYACPVPRNPHVSPAFPLALRRHAREAHIAHVHGVFNMPASAGQLCLRLSGLPYVVRPCGSLSHYGMQHRGILKRICLQVMKASILRAAARLQASTVLEQQQIEELGLSTPVALVPQGVDVERMPAGGKPFEGRYVLAIGRLHPVKGYPLLVRAFAQMCRAQDDLNLVLAGPDEQGHRREIEAVIRNCAVGARVHLLEAVQGQAKVDLLAHASVFAMPSFSENFGIAAVEAAAYGVPLLVSDRVGLCDAVQKYGAGEVASCDVDSVSDKLSLLFHRQRCYTPARMAQAFSWDARITELESLYRTVLQERQ